MYLQVLVYIFLPIIFALGNLLQAEDCLKTRAPESKDLIWQADYFQSLNLAKKNKKILLVAFVGSGWCPWSDKLQNEVLGEESFLQALQEDFVFLKVEFPESYAQFSLQNPECVSLKEKFHVQECPILMLVDPSEKAIAKISYLPLGAKEYANYIRDLLFDYRLVNMGVQAARLKHLSFDELKTLFTKAKRLLDARYQQTILDAGLKNDQGAFFLFEKYADLLTKEKFKNEQIQQLRRKILERDPINQHGSHLKLALIDFEFFSNLPKMRKKTQQVIGPLIEYIREFGKQDSANLWKVEMMVAEYLFSRNKVQEALKHAKASLDSAPDSAKKQVAEMLNFIKDSIQKPTES